MTLSDKDLEVLRLKGIDSEVIERQVELLSNPSPVPNLVRTASLGDGILLFDDAEIDAHVAAWDAYLHRAKRDVTHFVPASGHANRFFRDLYLFLRSDRREPQTNFEKNFFKHLPSFAFYTELNKCCLEVTGKDIDALLAGGDYKTIVRLMLTESGLNYQALPTALFKFHTDQSHRLQKFLPKKLASYYNSFEDIRTPLQETMYESAMVSGVKGGAINVSYSVRSEFRDEIRSFLRDFKLPIEKKMGVSINVTLPVQETASDSIVLNEDGTPYRDKKGNLNFHPAGHGTLLDAFNGLKGNVIFIKNIDNATPDPLKKLSVRYKKLLAGVMVNTQKRINRFMRLLEKEDIPDDQLIEVIHFVENWLNVKRANILRMPREEQIVYLKEKLNRPLRVCGVVKNEEEQGGAPCWVAANDGTVSLQMVEYYQINKDSDKCHIFDRSSHFNPVDMVCYVNDYKGKRFDFTQYADRDAYMILSKEIDGKEVKHLEQPGLWNGGMANWNTILVEVPIKTFNPVKNINDLLRHEHQNT